MSGIVDIKEYVLKLIAGATPKEEVKVDPIILLKEKYNKLALRRAYAELYMDCYHLTGEELKKAIEEREKFVPAYLKILDELHQLLDQIGEHTKNDIENGFYIEEIEEAPHPIIEIDGERRRRA